MSHNANPRVDFVSISKIIFAASVAILVVALFVVMTGFRSSTGAAAPVASTSGSLAIGASTDGWVSQTPSRGNNSSSLLSVSGGPNTVRRAYLAFDVHGIPADATGIHATLSLWSPSGAAPNVNLTVRQASTGWTRSGLTWQRQPWSGPVVASRSGLARNAYSTFDVSQVVTGNRAYAVAVGSTSPMVDSFYSSQAWNGRPVLTVSWKRHPSPTPTTSSPSATASSSAPTSASSTASASPTASSSTASASPTASSSTASASPTASSSAPASSAPASSAPASSSASASPTPTATSTPCSGVSVAPSADLASVVSSSPTGTTFCLQPGVFRLSGPVVPRSGDVISGQPGTVLNGSQVVTGWQSVSTSVWSASGFLPPAYTDSGYNPCQDTTTNLCKWDEWLFRDDVELRRVASAAAVVPGTFYTDYSANRIYVGDNPSGHLLEVSRAPGAINSTADHVTIQGIRVEKFATPNQRGAVVANGPYWTVQNSEIRYSHGAGLYCYANNLQVLNNRIDHNGTLGIGVNAATGVLVQGNELDHNNTDGSLINDGENGGYKSTQSSDTITGNNVHDNLGMGLWFDIDDNGNTITNNTVTNNASSGIRYEISYNGTITGNTITGNGLNRQQGDGSLYYGAGLDLSNANTVTVSGNVVTGNDNGIGLVMQNRGSGKYGTWILTNVSVHDNQIDMTQGVTGLVESVSDTSYFTTKNNHFATDHYKLDSLSSMRFGWLNADGTPSFWTNNGQDTTGTFTTGP